MFRFVVLLATTLAVAQSTTYLYPSAYQRIAYPSSAYVWSPTYTYTYPTYSTIYRYPYQSYQYLPLARPYYRPYTTYTYTAPTTSSAWSSRSYSGESAPVAHPVSHPVSHQVAHPVQTTDAQGYRLDSQGYRLDGQGYRLDSQGYRVQSNANAVATIGHQGHSYQPTVVGVGVIPAPVAPVAPAHHVEPVKSEVHHHEAAQFAPAPVPVPAPAHIPAYPVAVAPVAPIPSVPITYSVEVPRTSQPVVPAPQAAPVVPHQESVGHHQVSHVTIPGQVGVGGGYTSAAFYETAPAPAHAPAGTVVIPSVPYSGEPVVASDVKVAAKASPEQQRY